jgi:FAD/FMN-containing dehydrogenase
MIFSRLRALLGPAAVDRDPDNLPRVTPDSTDALALVCRLAHDEGWTIRVEGLRTWLPPDAPADLAVSTRGLDEVVSVSPADLVATVKAGASMDAVRRRLAEESMWLAVDPPGRPDRTLGSVIATGTSGPLRLGFGPVRDHVLGCTVVTGDGRTVHAGGRVVKNVAGYDLTKLHVGGFGGFGIVTEAHLRLRALPRADVTLLSRGGRDNQSAVARDLLDVGIDPAALELISPSLAGESEWVLAARFLGVEAGVQAEVHRLPAETGATWTQLAPDRTADFWISLARGSLNGSVTFRLGVLPGGIDDALDLLGRELDTGVVSAGAASGAIRWTGDAGVDRLRGVRRSCAAREIPMTLERAPWSVRHALGHFGAYREGVGQLVGRLRNTFDPRQCLKVALEGSEK